ncbi:hypothetical protein BJ165DRAFT_1535338 [Panaeolus papilionaceus]|nr:hypothetical protein BJ165DRAFT_1535338 [Panaeolus papilionaceus]
MIIPRKKDITTPFVNVEQSVEKAANNEQSSSPHAPAQENGQRQNPVSEASGKGPEPMGNKNDSNNGTAGPLSSTSEEGVTECEDEGDNAYDDEDDEDEPCDFCQELGLSTCGSACRTLCFRCGSDFGYYNNCCTKCDRE